MIICKYKTVETIEKHYGTDWSNLILNGVNLKKKSIKHIKLPDDNEFFQKIKDKSLFCTGIPDGDYSEYNFNNVDIIGARFDANSKFCADRNVFIKVANRKAEGAMLPKGDYSRYNFDFVSLKNCRFTRDSIFSEDTEVFQKIMYGGLTGTRLPKGDYRNYNFKYVSLLGVRFTSDSLLPEYGDFLKDIGYNTDFILTDNVIKNIHNYNLEGVRILLRSEIYSKILTQNQLDILKNRYPDAIGSKIILPDVVYGDNLSDYGYKI